MDVKVIFYFIFEIVNYVIVSIGIYCVVFWFGLFLVFWVKCVDDVFY